MKAWPVLAILVIQILLLLAHWFVYSTWIAFWPGMSPQSVSLLHTTMLVLAFSFVVASLLSFRLTHVLVHFVYWLSAVWLGFLNFFFWASCLAWLCWLALKLTHLTANPDLYRAPLAGVLFALAALAGIYGLFNARILRIRRIPVRIPGLPEQWRGRRGVLMSDVHLGPINGVRFCRRLVAHARRLDPHIVFLPGDLFDGAHADLDRLLDPFRQLDAPYGIYYSTGNHEEFTDSRHYTDAIARVGIRVLANEQIVADGLSIAGVLYHDSASPLRMKAALDTLRTDSVQPVILLNHAPIRLPIVEQAGFRLQLSGHTHGGQFHPYTWITRSIFGPFTHGLHQFGALQVYTSTGAGSWGPPMRLGTQPEIVVLTFE